MLTQREARFRALNLGALLIALVAASWGASVGLDRAGPDAGPEGTVEQASMLTDARGSRIQARAFERIVSLDPEASLMLLDLVEPSRLVAVSSYVRNTHPFGFRFDPSTVIVERSGQAEEIAALNPDLVLVTPLASKASVQRLRELGLKVFDLGGVRGISRSREQFAQLGTLVGEQARAEQAIRALAEREQALKQRVGPTPRYRGIFLVRYGDKLMGGTQGTSYADLLRLSGVQDLAALQGYRAWPTYGVEEILAMDPEVILTAAGHRAKLCSHPQLRSLRACEQGQVVEAPEGLDSAGGSGLLAAAGAIQARLYPTTSASW